MPRTKPSIKIPYKRYEKSFDRTEATFEDAQDEFSIVVQKDITINPSVVTTNLKHERIGGDAAAESTPPVSADNKDNPVKDEAIPGSLNVFKAPKIRRKRK